MSEASCQLPAASCEYEEPVGPSVAVIETGEDRRVRSWCSARGCGWVSDADLDSGPIVQLLEHRAAVHKGYWMMSYEAAVVPSSLVSPLTCPECGAWRHADSSWWWCDACGWVEPRELEAEG